METNVDEVEASEVELPSPPMVDVMDAILGLKW
jgi:hypothetical protein